jgi:hypothetical protein
LSATCPDGDALRAPPSRYLQIFRALLASVRDDIEGHFGAFDERAKARFLNSRDMNEYIPAAAVGAKKP